MNPLGLYAMYLGDSAYRIHGTDAPWTIGTAVSKGCVRMFNQDVADLYPRVKVGAKVIVTWEKFKATPADENMVAVAVPAQPPPSKPAGARSTKPAETASAPGIGRPLIPRRRVAVPATVVPPENPDKPKGPVKAGGGAEELSI